MKTLSMYAVILFSIFSFSSSFAQTVKNDSIKVWGNCGMCKTKIEKAAKSAGATAADWNEDSKMLQVSYAVNKTTVAKIQQSIAKTGYDTQDFTADNKSYDKLHACCKYERKDASAGMAKDMACCKDKAVCSHAGKDAAGMGAGCCNKETCKHDGKDGACKDMACCKDKAACNHAGKDAAGMSAGCCKMETCKHDSKEGACKDMACCKDKAACSHAGKDTAGMSAGCCNKETCKHDGKAGACKDMAACKDKKCCSDKLSVNQN